MRCPQCDQYATRDEQELHCLSGHTRYWNGENWVAARPPSEIERQLKRRTTRKIGTGVV